MKEDLGSSGRIIPERSRWEAAGFVAGEKAMAMRELDACSTSAKVHEQAAWQDHPSATGGSNDDPPSSEHEGILWPPGGITRGAGIPFRVSPAWDRLTLTAPCTA